MICLDWIFLCKMFNFMVTNMENMVFFENKLYIFSMIGAARIVTEKMALSPYFQENENLWFHVYPGKDHGLVAFGDRIWNAFRIMWN